MACRPIRAPAFARPLWPPSQGAIFRWSYETSLVALWPPCTATFFPPSPPKSIIDRSMAITASDCTEVACAKLTVLLCTVRSCNKSNMEIELHWLHFHILWPLMSPMLLYCILVAAPFIVLSAPLSPLSSQHALFGGGE